MKSIAPAALQALDSGKNIIAGAVAIAANPPVNVWSGHGPINIDGIDFDPIADKGLVRTAGGALGSAARNIDMTLSGIDQETLALLDASEVKDAPTTIYRLIFDESGTELLDWDIWSRGQLDTLLSDFEIGGEAALRATLETAAIALGRRGGRMRSDADQRLIDPLDGFFKNVAFAGEKQLYWNGRRPVRAGTAVGGVRGSGGFSGDAGTTRGVSRF